MQIKKDYTREQIVVVARGIFLKKGYAKTSMRDIAAGVGMRTSGTDECLTPESFPYG